MLRSSITISLVPQAAGGPFVFWGDLQGNAAKAAELGYDAVEIFVPSAEAIETEVWRPLLERNRLGLAAIGTGAGWVLHRLTLSSAEAAIRARAREFVREIIRAAARLGAPAIVGSMQGRSDASVTRAQALAWIAEALEDLGEESRKCGVPLLFEPLNRYESNLISSVADCVELVRSLRTQNVRILADLFHMNIEESSIPDAFRSAGPWVGHVHLADSNRRPAGMGHTSFAPIAQALRSSGYNGYLSAEALPYPDSVSAARQTLQVFRQYFAAP